LPPDGDFYLKALRKGITGAEARVVWRLYRETGGLKGILGPWFDVVIPENEEVLTKEAGMNAMKSYRRIALQLGKKTGLWDEVRQEGRLEEREELTARIFQYLKNGHTLEEAEKEFSIA